MAITHSLSDVIESRSDIEDGRRSRVRERLGTGSRSSSCSSTRGLLAANSLSEDEDSPFIRHIPPENVSSMSRNRGDNAAGSDSMEQSPGEGFIHEEMPVLSGGAVQRMWEGELLDCFEDPSVAAQTAICPCLTFGQNMEMAGLGDCSVQALLFFLLTGGVFLCCQIVALYTATGYWRWLSVFLFLAGTGYGAYHRMEMRRKFNIHGSDMADYVYHGFCCLPALCQEGRTLQVNKVHNGIWSGRGNSQPLSISVVPSSPSLYGMETGQSSWPLSYSSIVSPQVKTIIDRVEKGTGKEEKVVEIPLIVLATDE